MIVEIKIGESVKILDTSTFCISSDYKYNVATRISDIKKYSILILSKEFELTELEFNKIKSSIQNKAKK